MKANERPINYERPQDQYPELESDIKEYFEVIARSNTHLYRVNFNPDRLWELYLYNLPEGGRFVYDCRACRQFIQNYGNLVIIRADGEIESALWGGYVPDFFIDSVRAMENYIKCNSVVSDVFVSDERVLGTPMTNGWSHLHAVLPRERINASRVKNAHQIIAEKREDRLTLLRALNEYPKNVVKQAVDLLQTNAMYRSDRVLGIAEWFLGVYDIYEITNSVRKTNLIWKVVAEAPAGFCHIKSSMIGTLLDDIKAGYSTRVVMARFEEKMNPQNYMRSQSAPTAAAIEQAEKLVEKIGIADSLRRRYARFEEVSDKCLWRPREKKVYDIKKPTGGIFANITPKDKPTPNDISLDLPTTTMTWAKFSRTILPTVDKIQVRVDNPNRFMALVTEAVPGSKNIFQWDNPFSWYYHGGIDAEIKKRVEAAGGQYENCKIRCSLLWNNYTDLDLHCITPNNRHIDWQVRRRLIDGGMLDVDANGCDGKRMDPVENMRWLDKVPNGHYNFVVHVYSDNNGRNNHFTAELQVGDKIHTYNGHLRGRGDSITVFSFDYKDGVVKNLRMPSGGSELSTKETWNLTPNTFVDVKGILVSPNAWGHTVTTNGDHTFFILDGCKDVSEGKGRGFFNEILQPDLREIRKVLEAYTANTPIEGIENSDACGVGFSTEGEWDLTLRVESNGNSRLIKIDRFD